MWEHFAPGGPIRVGGHHLAARFVRHGCRVAWCAGPLSPVNFARRNPETDARLRLWRSGGEWREAGRLFAYAPLTWLPHRPCPGFDRPAVQRRTLRATTPRLGRVLARAGFADLDLLWMSPGAPLLALLDDLKPRAAVYRMSDDTAAFPDTPKSFAAIEAETCRRCDLVIVAARRLVERARSLGARRVLHLPNGCDPERFGRDDLPEPAGLARWPRPRALYVGSLDWWVDVELIAAVARRLPRWSFVLIGPRRAPLGALASLPNVALVGPQPYDDLAAWMTHADAGLVPFAPGPMTHAIHPIKVYEYCAAGIPVVATPLHETMAMQAPIRFAGPPEEFAGALEAALREPAEERARRREFARRNSWDDRFASVRLALDELGVRVGEAGGIVPDAGGIVAGAGGIAPGAGGAGVQVRRAGAAR
jgi:glycosyltransferase involved in cell wall biosynthesis